jgi:hypothetical protein
MKKLSLVAALLGLSTLVPGGSAHAGDVVHKASGFTVWVPDDWKQTERDDGMLRVDGNNVTLYFGVSDAKSVEDFIKTTSATLDKLIKDSKITNGPKTEEVNGLVQSYFEGTGTNEGQQVDFDMTFIPGEEHSMVIVALGDIQSNQETVTKVYGSIAKSESGKE